MTYARREVWRSWAVKFGGSVGPQHRSDTHVRPRAVLSQHRSSRTRNVCDAPLRPRIPPGHQGGSIFRIRRKQSRAAPLGLFLRFYIKYPRVLRGVLALTVYASAATPLIVPSQGHLDRLKVSFAVWKFPASDHRACRLSIRRM